VTLKPESDAEALMTRVPKGGTVAFDQSLLIAAPPDEVVAAFLDAEALALWWQALRSVTTPQPLGVYAVEWQSTTFRDEVLGPLGGVFHGVVMDYNEARDFFVANAYWLPPEGEPLGPMGLEVAVAAEGNATRLRVIQTGAHDGPRWSRYYAVITPGWKAALRALRTYLEHGAEGLRASREQAGRAGAEAFPEDPDAR
jgi:uncharacterized protein YndB with AHSA1/START domain